MLPLISLTLLAVSAVARASTFPYSFQSREKTVDSVAAAWFAGWHTNASPAFPLANVSWDKYTHLTYSFAVTTPDVNTLSLEGSNPDVLPDFVSTAKQHGVKALVSIGGWTGSLYFSSNVATAENRTAFVNTVVKFATDNNLDGLDFDWEYPGSQGIGCSVVSPQDTTNFLSFLQELRQDPVGKNLFLTAATSVLPWKGPDGTPLTDVSGFAKVLDYIAVMNYDVSGSWLTYVGPNAPLNDTCAPSANQQGSAVSAIKAWTAAGMPAHQIVLGVPGYGHSFHVTSGEAFDQSGDTPILASFPPFEKAQQPTGDAWDDGAGVDECGVQQGPGGTFNFWGLIANGFLNSNGTAAPGIDYRFDECSQTPYVYSKDKQIMISYDDAQSFAAKGQFIASSNLRGFAMWEAGGDSQDILLDSIRSAIGFEDDGGDC